MTDLRPRPPRIQSDEYADYATDHQRICVRKVSQSAWIAESFLPSYLNVPFSTFKGAWAHVNHLLKETK